MNIVVRVVMLEAIYAINQCECVKCRHILIEL